MKTKLPVILFFLFFSCAAHKNVNDLHPEFSETWVQMKDPFSMAIEDSLRYLIPILDSVLISDQKYRAGLNQKKGRDLKKALQELLTHSKEIDSASKKNVETVSDILEKYGWLGYRKIGAKGYSAIFFVLQHADLSTQEKYFPVLKKALTDKQILPSHFAMFSDRIDLKNHRPQKYGTQVVITAKRKDLLPLLNPDSVDRWRAVIGMDSLKNYLKTWDITWNVGAYKKMLPVLKNKYGITQ